MCVHLCVSTCVCQCVYLCVSTYVCQCVCVCVCVCVRARVSVCVCARACVCVKSLRTPAPYRGCPATLQIQSTGNQLSRILQAWARVCLIILSTKRVLVSCSV